MGFHDTITRMYDICIIGSGPAGLTIASEFADANKKICVVESGGLEKSTHADSLREVQNTGEISIMHRSRERRLGGTSSTWTGISAPMDPIDMEGWPFGLSELIPFYRKSSKYGFPEFEKFEIKNWTPILRLEAKKFIAGNPPWHFGNEIGHIFDKPNIELIVDSTVTHLISKGTAVTGAQVKKTDGSTKVISAKKFVLAVGGIEAPRLLLLSTLGNEHDQVGRYLMNHPKKALGFFHFTKPTKNIPYILKQTEPGWSGYLGLRIKEDLQKSLGLVNSYFRLEEVLSLGQKIIRKVFPRMNFAITEARLWNFMEMEPIAENRLTLSETLDANGQPIPLIKIATTARDRKSIIELHRIFGEEMERAGIGRLESDLSKIDPWPIVSDASHHIGGTIMGSDPKRSVVDTNLKVHSVDNLYICSSSVFPTSGNANPTYTIVALAIRLAEYLRNV